MKTMALLSLTLILSMCLAIDARPQAALDEDQTIIHILNRLGFGPRPGDVDRVRKIGIAQFIDQQLHPEEIDDSAMASHLEPFQTLDKSVAELVLSSPEPQMVARMLGLDPQNAATPADQAAMRQKVQAYMQQMNLVQPQRIVQELMAHKLVRAVHSERQLQEVLTDFWFNHFNVFLGKNDRERFLITGYEMNAIRPHVLGKFKDLLLATAKSPAMLVYLDNAVSTAPDPRLLALMNSRGNNNRRLGINENYARELMELHTMGVDGGYTQNDVQEVARAFTGWSVAQQQNDNQMAQFQRQAARLGVQLPPTPTAPTGSFVFRAIMHDSGEKLVLGHTIKAGGGIEDGEQVLEILAAHPSTARFISTKLVRRFVNDNPPARLVDSVAETYTKSGGDIREMLRVIFSSQEFFAPETVKAKVKTPLELVASAIRFFDGTTDGGQPVIQAMDRMGQPLYRFQAPTGFPDRGDYWTSDGALLERINFSIALTSNRMQGTRVTFSGFSDPRAAALFAGSPDFQRR